MASFFRYRVVYNVLSLLQRRHNVELPPAISSLPSLVRVCREKCPEAQLLLPWKNVEDICKKVNVSISPTEMVRLLKNRGLPTAEGFLDIEYESRYSDLVFTVDKHIFSKIVLDEIHANDGYLRNSCLFKNVKRKNIVVQWSSPTIGDHFSLTHFRNALQANFITNINRFVGHNVVKVSHVNDWGINAAIFLNGYKRFKDKLELEGDLASQLLTVRKASAITYQDDMGFKFETDAMFLKMEEGDAKLLSEWQELKNLCMNYYDSVYKKIGVQYDDIIFDSSCFRESKKLLNELLEKSIISCNEGPIKIFSPDDYLPSNSVKPATETKAKIYDFMRYLNSAIQMKRRHDFDLLHIVNSSSQKEMFEVLFAVLRKLEYPWANSVRQLNMKSITEYIQKRKRDSIENVLDRLRAEMVVNLHESLQLELNESLKKMVEELSLASLNVYDKRFHRQVDYLVNWRELSYFANDSGAAFLLTHAGLKGMIEDSEYDVMHDTDTSGLLEPEAHALVRHLARFDEMVYKSYFCLEPCLMYQFLLTLQHLIDPAIRVLKLDIREDRLKVINARLLLLSATLKVLERSFYIIGVEPLKTIYSSEPNK